MFNQTSLANFSALRNSEMSSSRQGAGSLIGAVLLGTLLAQTPGFCQPAPAPPARCSARKPAFLQGTSLASSQVAVATMFASGEPGAALGQRDLVIWNNSTSPYTPIDNDWSTYIFPDPYYSDARWDYISLGDVFGLTLDDRGNIYVAATTAYGAGRTGVLADPQYPVAGRHGQIYKIDNLTAEPTPFVQLPNPHGAGLGNITFDSGHQSFYVSNIDDGLIYHLDASGAQLNTWDHGRNLNTATGTFQINWSYITKPLGLQTIPCTPPQGACKYDWDNQGYAKLGRRPWAVRVYQNRLYYSIWSMDTNHNTVATGSPSQNQIWSVGLDSTGKFVGPEHLEITLPLLPGRQFSNPVADLTFNATGTMIVAERTMQDDHMPYAHLSRVLEFQMIGQLWKPAVNTYAAGCDETSTGFASNSAGGVDVDLTPVPYGWPKFQVWATADKIHRNNENTQGCIGYKDDVYGLQGFPVGGGTVKNSVVIDLNAYTKQHNKTQLGDVKIPCSLGPSTGL